MIERLRGVIIDNRDALECMKSHDSKATLFYVDPPYVMSTRDSGSDYKYEMSDEEHINLHAFLNEREGFSCISGYRSELYDELYKDWRLEQKITRADGHRARNECLWFSPNFPMIQNRLI